jgi:TatD DNase family protein
VIIDTHTHIYLDAFDEDREAVIERARKEDVRLMLMPNVDGSTIGPMHKTADRYPDLALPMMGLHPCSVQADTLEEEMERVKEHLFKPVRKYWAVGEIGIDLYWDKSTLDLQVEAFEQQINWAKALDLPIVIHVRDAFDEVFEVVDRCNDERLRGVFHCFTGTKEQAEHIIQYGGFQLGIGGVLTFKNGKIDRFIHEIGLEHLVLETDAPYLAPVPHRGKRNEPSYTALVLEKLAGCFQMEPDEVASVTTRNAASLFRLDLHTYENTDPDHTPFDD